MSSNFFFLQKYAWDSTKTTLIRRKVLKHRKNKFEFGSELSMYWVRMTARLFHIWTGWFCVFSSFFCFFWKNASVQSFKLYLNMSHLSHGCHDKSVKFGWFTEVVVYFSWVCVFCCRFLKHFSIRPLEINIFELWLARMNKVMHAVPEMRAPLNEIIRKQMSLLNFTIYISDYALTIDPKKHIQFKIRSLIHTPDTTHTLGPHITTIRIGSIFVFLFIFQHFFFHSFAFILLPNYSNTQTLSSPPYTITYILT